MRHLIALLCSLSLIIQANAQPEDLDLRLDLSPGTTYQIDFQLQSRAQAEMEENNGRGLPIYTQNTTRYELTVLDRTDHMYRVELIRTLLQAHTVHNKFSSVISDYSTNFANEKMPFYRDTVRFDLDHYGRLKNLALPDSTTTWYVVPDTFRARTELVMPELVRNFSALFDFLQPNTVTRGDSWTSSSGARFTLVGKRSGLWHIKAAEKGDIYLDPATRWIRFTEQHLAGKDRDIVSRGRGRVDPGSDPARIRGKSPDHRGGSFLLRITPHFQGSEADYLIQVDDAGHFSWADTIRHPVYFQLTDLYQHNVWGYIEPGGVLELSKEQAQWNIEGATGEHCRYLDAFFRKFPRYAYFLQEGGEYDVGWPYQANLNQFWLDQLEEVQNAHQNLIQWSNRLNPEFIAYQKRQIDYLRTCAIHFNLGRHYIRQARSTKIVEAVPEVLEQFLDSAVIYNYFDRSLPAFRAFWHLNLQREMFGDLEGDINNIAWRPYESLYYFAQLNYKNHPLYQTTYDLLRRMISRNVHPDRVRSIYQHFTGIYSRENVTRIRPLAEELLQMEKLHTWGEKLPDLNFYDRTGQDANLSDLDGKPTVLMVLSGSSYWPSHLRMDDVYPNFPELRFAFLHIGAVNDDDQGLPAGENIIHFYSRTRSAKAAKTFLQFSSAASPQVYLLDRQGKIAGTLNGTEQLDEIIRTFSDLKAGRPPIDQQSQKGIFLLLVGLLAGGLIIGLITHQWQRELHRREQRRRQHIEAQLQAIRSQLNPHFMFNSMSSIQHLVKSGQSDRAQSYLGKLANLLRASLRYTREEFISLQEELDVVGQYCALEALRFNFSYDLKIDRALDTRAISIPPLLLQPYVENAVLHGIASLREQGKLLLDIREAGNQLSIRIRDNGPGVKNARAGVHQGHGIGLALNEERLRLVYGDAARVSISSPFTLNGSELASGTEVQIAMPIDV